MKSLVLIWVTAVITGFATLAYANSVINSLIVQAAPESGGIHLNGASLQATASPQQALGLRQADRINLQENNTIELQQALGRKAMGLEVNIQ